MQTKRFRLTQEQVLEAVKRYAAGDSPRTIGKALGVCGNNVSNALKDHGVVLRTRSEACTQLEHWKEAFDTITPDSAYWIGFLFADGTLYQRKAGAPVISIGLAERDRGHLEKLRAFLRSDHAITKHSNTVTKFGVYPAARFTISSYNLSAALASHGMRAKNLERIAPPALAISRDFWRGFVDGDGYVGASGKKERVGVCGGLPLLQQFLLFVRSHGTGDKSEPRPQGKIFRVDFTCGSALSIIRLLYENASTVLDRKYAIARALMNGDVEGAIRLRQPKKQETEAQRRERLHRRGTL